MRSPVRTVSVSGRVLACAVALGAIAAAGCTRGGTDADLGPIERLNVEDGSLASFTFPYYTALDPLPEGGAVAVWMRRAGPYRPLVMRRAPDARTPFGPQTPLSEGDHRDTIAIVPSLAQSEEGRALYAIWQARHPTSGNKLVLFRRSDDGGASWNPAQVINSRRTSFIPAMATDERGGVYVAWSDERRHGVKVFFNRSLDRGATWLAEDVRIDGTGRVPGVASSVGIATDGAGRLVVVWEDQTATGRRIRAVSSADRGGSWGAPVRVDDGESLYAPTAPSVVAVEGGVAVLWTAAASNTVAEVWGDVSRDWGRSWGSDVLVHETAAGVPTRVHLVSDQGRARALFHAGPGAGPWQIHYVATGPDGSWNPSDVTPVTAGEGRLGNARLAIDGETYYAVYEDRRKRVFVSRSTDRGGHWGTPVLVDAVAEGAGRTELRYPQIVAGAGTAWVMWERWADPTTIVKTIADADRKEIPADLFIRRVAFR